MSGKLFISYRRADEPAEARSLRDRLALTFGETSIFMDVDSLVAGSDFRQGLDAALKECAAFIAVIGPQWLRLIRERKSGNDGDYVMDEIASALRRDILVIPVLVRNAKMPSAADLPAQIADLAFRQARTLTHENFGADVSALASVLRNVLSNTTAALPILDARPQSIRVLVFTHEAGLTESLANEFKRDLSSPDVVIESIEHRDRSRPDAIYISERAPAELARAIVRRIRGDVTHIFPIDYATKSHSEMLNATIAVGLMSDFSYYKANSAERPYAISQSELNWLIEPELDQSVFLERLRYIAPGRLRRE